MEPFSWGGNEPFADGIFSTPDGKARLVPVKQLRTADVLAVWPFTSTPAVIAISGTR
jgi:assimilatory nitrate reductase catalytic subunit